MMGLISALLPTLTSVIDKAVPDVEQRERINAMITTELLRSEASIKRAASDVIMAEVSGGWLQRNWRPAMMVWFAFLVGAYWFGFTPPNLSEERIGDLFQLVQIGIGGYIVGRSGEKIATVMRGGDR